MILVLLLLLVPQFYIDRRYLRRQQRKGGWRRRLTRWLRWVPTMLMAAWTVVLSLSRDFVPQDMTWLNIYLLILGIVFVPKAVFWLSSLVGGAVRRLLRKRYNWGSLVGLALAIPIIAMAIYGSTAGIRQLSVKRVELAFKDLPTAFDGYRIVLFSDLHVGSFTRSLHKTLQRDIDSINAQQADMIVFAGDIQNLRPSELYPVQDMLRKLKAHDGVFSVLGNHDYSAYINDDPAIKAANERETVSREQQMGWMLLRNENHTVKRGGQSIVIAGEEDAGGRAETDRDDLGKTLKGVADDAFVVMVQHDPKEWRRSILPGSNAQLTLSGHTHGGQVSLFGLRGTQLTLDEDYGLYNEGGRLLYVTSGLGALVPFRLGVKPEIVVITLRKEEM